MVASKVGVVRLRALVPHRLVDLVRTGERTVYAIPEWAGFGNQLFFLLWGATQQWSDRDYWMVRSKRAEPWLEKLPLMRQELTLDRSEVRFRDRRDRAPWDPMPVEFTAHERSMFIRRYLLSTDIFNLPLGSDADLTINVRRGDYYSDPQVRGLFSFDQIAYLQTVLEDVCAQRDHRFRRIVVVSDDLQWCRARLEFLRSHADEIVFGAGGGPFADLATVAAARNLVITNSTFSIWGAYISNELHGDNHSAVWAPAFGTRPFTGETWGSLDPRWSIVRDIPGGWDS